MKFQRKPLVVDAVQFHMQEYADNPLQFEEVPKWLDAAINQKIIRPKFMSEDYWYLVVKSQDIKATEGSDMIAKPGDWVCKNDKGEIFVSRGKFFEETYERLIDDK